MPAELQVNAHKGLVRIADVALARSAGLPASAGHRIPQGAQGSPTAKHLPAGELLAQLQPCTA